MQRILPQIHQKLAWVFLAGLALQVYLAGTPMFGVTSFSPHRMLGSALLIVAFLFPILAVMGRLPRRLMMLSVVLAVLTIVQMMLPSLRSTASWIAALHSVNALALVGMSIRMSRGARGVAA